MAFLYITEFANLPNLNSFNSTPQAPVAPGIAEQRLAVGANVASAAFNTATRFVMLHTDNICSLAWSKPGDADPVAVITAQRMNANETRFYGVYPGGKVAVILNT